MLYISLMLSALQNFIDLFTPEIMLVKEKKERLQSCTNMGLQNCSTIDFLQTSYQFSWHMQAYKLADLANRENL